MIGLSLVAIAIGVLSTGVALVLLKLIALATNLFYFHRAVSRPCDARR